MRTISDLVEEIKSRERQELIDALYKCGEDVTGGFEVKFDEEEPVIIAGYLCEDPCDIVVTRAFVSYDGDVSLDGYDKNNAFDEFKDIDVADIFAGHLSYVTEAVMQMR